MHNRPTVFLGLIALLMLGACGSGGNIFGKYVTSSGTGIEATLEILESDTYRLCSDGACASGSFIILKPATAGAGRMRFHGPEIAEFYAAARDREHSRQIGEERDTAVEVNYWAGSTIQIDIDTGKDAWFLKTLF